jgi:hypothetical protein
MTGCAGLALVSSLVAAVMFQGSPGHSKTGRR